MAAALLTSSVSFETPPIIIIHGQSYCTWDSGSINLQQESQRTSTADIDFDLLFVFTEASDITERYTLIEELKTWTEAQQYCRGHHTDLVSIKNVSENEELVKKAQGKPFWIGLFNEPWKWSRQGDSYTFHNWSNGEPNNRGGDQNCVLMSKSGEWFDYDCNDQNSFFCCEGGSSGQCFYEETKKTWQEAQSYCRNQSRDLPSIHDQARVNELIGLIPSTNDTAYWIGLYHDKENWQWSSGGGSSGQCFYEETKKTWQEAQSYCRNQGRDLPSIQDQAMVNKLISLTSSVGDWYWIGLYHDKENWQWSSGGDVIYSNWEPHLFCASVNAEGEWEDSICDQNNYFMCYSGTPVPEELHLISHSMVWPEAWQYCKDHYTDLVSLTSLAAQNRVSELVRNSTASRFWIGLHRTVVYDNCRPLLFTLQACHAAISEGHTALGNLQAGTQAPGQSTGVSLAVLGQLWPATSELPSTVGSGIAWTQTDDLQAIGRILHSTWSAFTGCATREPPYCF
ncbi:UNVERIFIED_CONTAM: hypothetical protein FKN15_031128 [Acipenser sinensis]